MLKCGAVWIDEALLPQSSYSKTSHPNCSTDHWTIYLSTIVREDSKCESLGKVHFMNPIMPQTNFMYGYLITIRQLIRFISEPLLSPTILPDTYPTLGSFFRVLGNVEWIQVCGKVVGKEHRMRATEKTTKLKPKYGLLRVTEDPEGMNNGTSKVLISLCFS